MEVSLHDTSLRLTLHKAFKFVGVEHWNCDKTSVLSIAVCNCSKLQAVRVSAKHGPETMLRRKNRPKTGADF